MLTSMTEVRKRTWKWPLLRISSRIKNSNYICRTQETALQGGTVQEPLLKVKGLKVVSTVSQFKITLHD